MSVINNSIGSNYQVRLLIDNPEVRKALAKALVRWKERVYPYYNVHVRPYTPAYRSAAYITKYGRGDFFYKTPSGRLSHFKVPRSKGDTDNLRKSFYAKTSEKDATFSAYWEADSAEDYAVYISMNSPFRNPRIKRHMTPGTTLHWVSKSKPKFRLLFWQIFSEELRKAGLLKGRMKPHHYFAVDEGTIFASV
jgi:hypothetical protein